MPASVIIFLNISVCQYGTTKEISHHNGECANQAPFSIPDVC